ncbi:MAG TPA: methyltransferase [Gaiellaceae bacterium]|nr:methyltransferase [Gaiellaceae bacterium]
MSEISPEERVWVLMRGALATRALAIVSELGVADALAEGPKPVAEIAQEIGADADALHRLLRALATEDVFAEGKPGVFGNTAESELLRRGGGWDDFSHLFGGVWYRTMGDLRADGEPSFPRLFGTDFWDWLAAHPDERAAFDRSMQQGHERRVERLAELDWRDDETVVDVGGGNGALLVQLLRLQPGLRGIVFDLPETVRDEAALGDRIAFVEGDFFRSVPEGDAYVLSGILHDWSDERAAAILRTIGAAAPRDARVLIVDAVVPPGNEPGSGKWLDVLVLALLDGRERNEQQWRELLAAGGFAPIEISDGLIEAMPA